MVFDILRTPIAISCPVRFQILTDIESFAFLFSWTAYNTQDSPNNIMIDIDMLSYIIVKTDLHIYFNHV